MESLTRVALLPSPLPQNPALSAFCGFQQLSAAMEADTFRPAKRLKAALAPNVFAQFTALANQHKAANLGQGFPSFGSPSFLKEAVQDAIAEDVFAETGAPKSLGNQYTRPGGEPNLAQSIARVYGPRFNRELDPLKEIVTTIGAQEAIFTTLFSWTDPGDEVILFTPCFDAVVKSASTLGVKLVGVNMRPKGGTANGTSNGAESSGSSGSWSVDMEELEAKISSKTRILMFNTPSAPLGKVFRRDELEAMAEVIKRHPRVLVISDEASLAVLSLDYVWVPQTCSTTSKSKDRLNVFWGFSGFDILSGDTWGL